MSGMIEIKTSGPGPENDYPGGTARTYRWAPAEAREVYDALKEVFRTPVKFAKWSPAEEWARKALQDRENRRWADMAGAIRAPGLNRNRRRDDPVPGHGYMRESPGPK